MTTCVGWLLDVSIDNNHVILWIKTEEGQTVKLRDSYHPGFYILPRNESDASRLIQILSSEEEISGSWEYQRTNLFDSNEQTRLIHVKLRSLRYYQSLLKKLECDCKVKQLYNTDLLHVQQYLFSKLKIEPTRRIKVEHNGSNSRNIQN